MGINGLLPLLKSIHKQVNLRKFEGKTIGVDAYGWLHRGTVACAMDLVLGKPTHKFVEFAMHRVRMLQHFGVIPFLIFDGDYLPSKAETEKDRVKRRADSRKAGLELLNAGKTSQALLEFQKAVDVTPEMARQVIDELKKTGVQYIVAPYEADAQMAFMEREGVIDAILSEDSDLLVFGSRCLLTKLDQYGNCVEINRADFCVCREINLAGWSDADFRHMAILSGCDYLASINNMGLKTAYRMVRKHKTVEKIIKILQFDGKYYVPKGYLEAFHKAELTFLYQRVFCQKTSTIVLNSNSDGSIDEDKLPFIGGYLEPAIAQGVARGDLNPMTKQPIIVEPKKMVLVSTSWSTPRPQPRKSISSNDVNKVKSIDTFFKPKRIPLAELDPNCFTPSPTQQEALQRNMSSSWLAREAPRPYLNRRSAEPQHHSQPASPQARTTLRQSKSGPTAISEPRPPKRARLCAESQSPVNVGSKFARSGFFASPLKDTSPNIGSNAANRHPRKSDITIFSDDSIDEALTSLPETEFTCDSAINSPSLSQVNPKVKIRDPYMSDAFMSRSHDEIMVPRTTTPSFHDTASAPTSNKGACRTFSTSQDVVDPKARFSLRHRVGSTLESSSDDPMTPSSSLLPTNPPQFPFTNRICSFLNTKSNFREHATLTPLQRLGASASSRKQSHLTPSFTPINSLGCKPPPMKSRALAPVLGAANKRIDPAMVPLPSADEAENTALADNKGSEDMIVHDSEEDEDCYPQCMRLNLGQFVYAG